tara:strand:- start:383 stop:559 length:177 start_codon:yes stop_codon:yes gene_type:complete
MVGGGSMIIYKVYQYVEDWNDYSPFPSLQTTNKNFANDKIKRLTEQGFKSKLIKEEEA